MSVPRFKSRRQYPDATPQSLNELYWEVLDLADNGTVILAQVPSTIVVDVVEQLNKTYGEGVKDGTISERLSHAGGLKPVQASKLRLLMRQVNRLLDD